MITVMSREEQCAAVLDSLRRDITRDGRADPRVLGLVQQILYMIESSVSADCRARDLVRQAYGVLDAHDIARNERREVSS